MALQVPELAVTAYMVFFVSKESKRLTTITGVGGLIGVTIAIGRHASALQVDLRLSRIAHSRNGDRAFSWNVVVAHSSDRTNWIHYRLSRRVHAIHRGSDPLTRTVGPCSFVGVGSARLRRRGHSCAAPPVFAGFRRRSRTSTKTKEFLVPDAFTNPAHVQFALKVTFAAMFCYIVYEAIDWTGIHTAFITCTFIALESTEATLYKGTLRIVGCVIGGALALFSIVFLMPHMETIASLVVVVARASAIAGWVTTGSQRISYAGLQIAFAFFYSVFQGYAPDTDLDNVRNRVVGILFGLVVTSVVFHYIWPERARIGSRESQ